MNPWSEQLIQRERSFADNESEMGGAYAEAERADAMSVRKCGLCGADAYMKSTIGCYKCPECGALDFGSHWEEGA